MPTVNEIDAYLKLISEWVKSCGLDLKPSKTELIISTRNSISLNPDLPTIYPKMNRHAK